MNPRDSVILDYSGIPPETTQTGQLCPKCRGGSRGETSLSVGRTGGFLWWRCHRASCQWVGKDSHADGGATTFSEKEGRRKLTFKRQTIPGHLTRMFDEQYGLDRETLDKAGWSYTPNYDGYGPRVIMPIYSPDGRTRGESFRSYSGHRKKALINGLLAENMIGWYRWRKYGKTLIIVEDAVSAVRVAQAGTDCLCLFGTMLNVDRAIEIRQQEYNEVYISLDEDATAQAIKHVRDYGRYIPNLRIRSLTKDIKDMNEEELDAYLYGI